MSRLYLVDSNVYIRAFREPEFGQTLREFHAQQLPRLVLSAVVAAELMVGALQPDRVRGVRRALVEPFRARRRFVTPSWSTWELAASVDRGLRARPANRPRLALRSFLQDILIAASAREVGATIITENAADFALISSQIDITFVKPWPTIFVA